MSVCVCFTTGSTQPTAPSQEHSPVPVVFTAPLQEPPTPGSPHPPLRVASTPTATSHHQPTEHTPGTDDHITI